MSKEIVLTREGLEKIKGELAYLKTVRRKEIAQWIKEARKYGDITENSEYDEAKNEQAFVEGRIKDLEIIFRNAKIIEEDAINTNQVQIGTVVTLKDIDSGERFTYTIVGSVEADPAVDKISNESPVGRAIIGKKKGSVVKVEVPVGTIEYKIENIGKREAGKLNV